MWCGNAENGPGEKKKRLHPLGRVLREGLSAWVPATASEKMGS